MPSVTKRFQPRFDMVERIRQEIRKVGFWKNDADERDS